jgi:predicted DNA-binding transcriptional regulator AlpA
VDDELEPGEDQVFYLEGPTEMNSGKPGPGKAELIYEDGRVEIVDIDTTPTVEGNAREQALRWFIEALGGCVEPPTLTPDAIAAAVREALGRNDLGLVNENELAAMLGVAVSTLQTWRSNREGPAFVRAGRSVLYRTAAIIDWLEQTETQTRDAVQPSDGRRKRR